MSTHPRGERLITRLRTHFTEVAVRRVLCTGIEMTSAMSRTLGYAVAASGVAFAAQSLYAFADSPSTTDNGVKRNRALIVDAGSGCSRTCVGRIVIFLWFCTYSLVQRFPPAHSR